MVVKAIVFPRVTHDANRQTGIPNILYPSGLSVINRRLCAIAYPATKALTAMENARA